MKTFITTLFLLTLWCCSPTTSRRHDIDVSSDLYFGEWQLDSSSIQHWFGDRLIIRNDKSVYWFSGSDGGSLFYRGHWDGEDTLTVQLEQKMKIELLDSNHVQVTGGWNNLSLIFSRTSPGDLQTYLKQDSLRKRVIGWWKVESLPDPFRLPNYSGVFSNFTLNIDDSGNTTFYLDNKFDSTATYSYHIYENSLSLQRGCIVTNIQVSLDGDSKMRLSLPNGLEMKFNRLTDIK